MTEITEIFLEMLKYPASPKIYRQIRDFFKHQGMNHEANAFTHLLKTKYNEPDNNNNNLQ